MNKYGWNITLPESVLKTQEILNGLVTPALVISEAWKNAIPHYDFSGVQAAMNAYVKNLEIISTQVSQMSSVAKSVLPLIDTSVYASLVDTQAIKSALASIDWSWITQAQEEESADGIEPVDEEMVTQEIRAEMAADIAQVLSKPEEMQSVSHSKYLQWKERNPGFAAFFLDILYPLLLVLIGALMSQCLARLDKNSQVYAEPSATSDVVYNLTIENNITVIGDAPYYYEVEFANPETGELVTGYVYKGNVTIEEPEETVIQEEAENTEEDAATESSEAVLDTMVSPTEPTE